MRRHRLIPARALLTLATLCACGLGAVQAASGDQPVRPLPQASAPAKTEIQERKTSLPAKGLFVGDQLSAAAKDKLTELILNALGLHVQVALVVPTGPWQIDGSGKDERDLTGPAGKVIVAHAREGTKAYVMVARWKDGAERYYSCSATLDGAAAVALAPAFTRACEASLTVGLQ